MKSLPVQLACVTACQPDASLCTRIHLLNALLDDEMVSSQALSPLFDLCCSLCSSGSSGASSSSSSTDPDINEAVTAAAAALVLLNQKEVLSVVLRQYVQQVFLPLAAAAAGTPACSQLLQQVTQLLVSREAWEIASEITQCIIDTLAAALEETSISSNRDSCVSSLARSQQLQQQVGSGTGQVRWKVTYQLPAETACIAAEQLITAATKQMLQVGQSDAVLSVMQLASGPLFTTACGLLACSSATLQKAAFQQLLPALLPAAEAVSPATHKQCIRQLWLQCVGMVAEPALPRRMGLAVLLQYHSAWSVQPPTAAAAQSAAAAEQPAAAAPADVGAVATHSSEQFWVLLRGCLVDAEPLNRKRACRLLQLLLPEAQLAAEPVWGVWLALYELLDEFSPHLVKAAWPQVRNKAAPHGRVLCTASTCLPSNMHRQP